MLEDAAALRSCNTCETFGGEKDTGISDELMYFMIRFPVRIKGKDKRWHAAIIARWRDRSWDFGGGESKTGVGVVVVA